MQASPYKRILVTGANGFLGHHIVPALKSQLDAEVVAVARKDYDLLKPGEPERMLKDVRPDAVIHLAAKVGGIIANRDFPADFYCENVVLNTLTFDACFKAGVKKYMGLIGGCSYPSTAPSPIPEEQMWNGYPQVEAAPYSIAKRILLVQSDSYRRQHGFNSVVLIPGNVYGEHDNFNPQYSHVIPALIRRFIEAKEAGKPSIQCFGSGRPTRDFVYAGDVAALIPWFLVNYNTSEPINISSGTRITIRELAETIRKVTGFPGALEWDTSKPDGQMDKIFGVKRLHALGLQCPTPLEEGLRRTADWFVKARKEGTVRL
jgi:GDP-L-fucose synthase